MLLILVVQLYNDNELKKEISKNCGWGEEDYQCYCEKNYIEDVKSELKGGFNFSNVKLDS